MACTDDEQTLGHSEGRFRLLAERSAGIVLSTDAAGVITWASASAATLAVDDRPLVGTAAVELIDPDDRGPLASLDELEDEGRVSWVARMTPAEDDAPRWFELEIRTLPVAAGAPRELHWCLWDVTRWRRSEEALLAERRRLAEAQTLAGLGSWETTDGPVRWSAEMWRITGLDPAQVTPSAKALQSVMHAADRPGALAAIAAAKRTGHTVVQQLRLDRPDGSQAHVLMRAAIVHDDEGTPRLRGTLQDVTDRVETENHQEILRALAERVAAGESPSSLYGPFADRVRATLRAVIGTVVRYDAAAESTVVIASVDSRGACAVDGTTGLLSGRTAAAVAYRTWAPARVDFDGEHPDEPADPAFAVVREHTIASSCAAPIIVGGQRWGAVTAAFTDPEAARGAEERLVGFAQLVSLALSSAEARESLAAKANTDPLTGLANHRSFYERLADEVSVARRTGRRLSLVMIDVDHFKSVNDNFGHQTGDRVLAGIAKRLRLVARQGELIGRLGGEEFAWLLPDSDASSGYAAAERVRRRIADRTFGAAGTITVSAGVAELGQATSAETLVGRADRALYAAKGLGRNMTVIDDASVDSRS